MAGELTRKDKLEWELLSADGEWPSNWPSWVLESLKKMEVVELPLLKWIPVASRLWVCKIVMRIISESCPTIRKADDAVSGARFLGRAVGHQFECLQLLEGACERAGKEIDEHDARLRQKLSPKAYARLEKKGERYVRDLERLAEDFSAVAEKKMALCLEAQALASFQSREESADFAIGMGESRAVRIMNDSGEVLVGGYRMSLYVLLLIFWRLVERFQSSVQLYRWSCLLLGQAQVGDIYSFQRLCRTYSIRLGARGKRVSKRRMRRRKRMR
ncbi:MAG: hypothetical protein WCS70_05270 [Verrucomicrobiota bacterium]